MCSGILAIKLPDMFCYMAIDVKRLIRRFHMISMNYLIDIKVEINCHEMGSHGKGIQDC